MSARPIETATVVQMVEDYVSHELHDQHQYSNRAPLDDAGVWSLHALAAEVYALGFRDGEGAEGMRERGRRQRAKETPDE